MKAPLFSTFFLLTMVVHAQPTANELVPVVDERVELMSIVSRLAQGIPGEKAHNPVYAKSIDWHFKLYTNHALISYVKKMMDSLAIQGVDISTWELPSLAVHLGSPPEFNPLIVGDTANIDGWDDRTLLTDKMVTLIRQFYHEARCRSFFESQAAYYERARSQYRHQNIVPQTEWVLNFTGLQATETYYPILSLQATSGAYLRVNSSQHHRMTYSIFTCSSFDGSSPTGLGDPGIPRLMIHEYVHAYVNQLVDKYKDHLKKPAEKLLANPQVWSRMKETFYNNWPFLLYESMVRACSIKYIVASGRFATTLEEEIMMQEKAGFLWMKDMLQELEHYESNRVTYKDLDSFMPRIIACFEKSAEGLGPSKN